MPKKILVAAHWQVEQLKVCMDEYEFQELTSFQRRPIPLNLIIESNKSISQESSNIPFTTRRSIFPPRPSRATKSQKAGK